MASISLLRGFHLCRFCGELKLEVAPQVIGREWKYKLTLNKTYGLEVALDWSLRWIGGCGGLEFALYWRLRWIDGCGGLEVAVDWRLRWIDGCGGLEVAVDWSLR